MQRFSTKVQIKMVAVYAESVVLNGNRTMSIAAVRMHTANGKVRPNRKPIRMQRPLPASPATDCELKATAICAESKWMDLANRSANAQTAASLVVHKKYPASTGKAMALLCHLFWVLAWVSGGRVENGIQRISSNVPQQ